MDDGSAEAETAPAVMAAVGVAGAEVVEPVVEDAELPLGSASVSISIFPAKRIFLDDYLDQNLEADCCRGEATEQIGQNGKKGRFLICAVASRNAVVRLCTLVLHL